MKINKIIMLCIFLLFSLTGILANQTCIDNQTLQILKNFNFTEDSTLTQYEFIENIYCEWGCDNVTHSCIPEKTNQNLIVLGIILGISIILFILLPKIFGR